MAWGAGSDFVDYCIRNLGFIAVASSESSIHVKLRPSVVSPVAFAGLMYWLGEHMSKRMMLSVLAADWTHRVIKSAKEGVTELAQLVQQAQTQRDKDFLKLSLDPSTLQDASPFAALVRLHDELAQSYQAGRIDEVQTVLDEKLRGRYLITKADANLKHIVVATVGDGHSVEANYWLKRGIDHRLNDLADTSYGQWATLSHFEAARSRKPQLDHLDIVVDWPSQGRQRYTFQRLLMPLQHNADGHAILCATLSDRTIDLRTGSR